LQLLGDRSRDLVRNDPIASGDISTVVEDVIGTGLWLQARPGVDALKVTDDEQETLTETVERTPRTGAKDGQGGWAVWISGRLRPRV
jgi:capsid protein